MARKVEWTESARAGLRRIDREAAMRILEGLARFLLTEEGDVKLLKDSDPREYRLRIGDYRVRFHDAKDTLRILSVRHRREAYR